MCLRACRCNINQWHNECQTKRKDNIVWLIKMLGHHKQQERLQSFGWGSSVWNCTGRMKIILPKYICSIKVLMMVFNWSLKPHVENFYQMRSGGCEGNGDMIYTIFTLINHLLSPCSCGLRQCHPGRECFHQESNVSSQDKVHQSE